VARVRIATVPATHVYVRHLDDPVTPTVTRVADPSGDDHRTPCFLDPDWWREEAPGFDLDVLHVHFGFEYHPPSQLEAVCTEARRLGVGVVHTVHDLRNPNHPTPDLHERSLAVWMRYADELITLTPWAARRIERSHRRRSTVLPHPHVVPLPELTWRASAPRRRHADDVRIGLHLKSLRANMFGADLLRAALDALADQPAGVRLRVHLHSELADPDGRCHDAELVALASQAAARVDARMDLHVHPYLSDDELWDLIASCDAYVLPYRFGTHSGLLEACRDLGTAVVAPALGGYVDQGAHHTFAVGPDGSLDAGSLADALRAAATGERPDPVPVHDRRRQRAELAAGHLDVYRRAAGAARRRLRRALRATA
jgi:beta-1,4-mannosyltransferase